MKYVVSVLCVVDAKDAKDAQDKVNTKLYSGMGVVSFNIGEATAKIDGEIPPLSLHLDEFVSEAINQNYDDPNNSLDNPDEATTTLKYVADEMDKMTEEDIADWCDPNGNYKPEENGGVPIKNLVGHVRIELSSLIEKYGGNTLAHKFIKKDEENEEEDD